MVMMKPGSRRFPSKTPSADSSVGKTFAVSILAQGAPSKLGHHFQLLFGRYGIDRQSYIRPLQCIHGSNYSQILNEKITNNIGNFGKTLKTPKTAGTQLTLKLSTEPRKLSATNMLRLVIGPSLPPDTIYRGITRT